MQTYVKQMNTLLKLYETGGAVYRLPIKYWTTVSEPDGK